MPATSTTRGTAASTASDGVVYTGFGGAAATTTAGNSGSGSNSSAATRVIIDLGQMYGLGAVVIGIFVGFFVML